MKTTLIIMAGSLVGLLSTLGLLVVVRVIAMAFGLRRAVLNAPAALDAHQQRLNAAQASIVSAQRELARRKRQA